MKYAGHGSQSHQAPINERKSKILAKIEFEYVRLKFSTSSTERNETLRKIERYNEQLSKLLQGCDEVSAAEESQLARRSKGRIDPRLTDFHRHADQLYTMLSKAWQCSCRSQHSVQLQLRHRKTAEFNFTVFFVFGQSMSAQLPQWTWRETKIMMIERAKLQQDLKMGSASTLEVAPTSTSGPSTTDTNGGSSSGFRIRGSAKRRKVEGNNQCPTNAPVNTSKKRVGFADSPLKSASVCALSSPFAPQR